jgi:thiamine-monophosphate kinase
MKQQIVTPSENKIVRLLQKKFLVRDPSLVMGIGDDAAVVRPRGCKEAWLVTTDMLVEDIDFRRKWSTPAQLGHKSLAVNLSDIASMGGRPRFYAVSLAIPAETPEKWISDFYRGMKKLGDSYAAILIGGDLSRSTGGITISITVIGESLKQKVLYRSGGNPCDRLYVTGRVGKSAAGLKLLEEGRNAPRAAAQRAALKAHLNPEPRCAAGLWLAQSGLVTCMMDLSDGISADLPRLCQASAVGAVIYTSWLPIFQASSNWGCDPLEMALHGGEDFELLFAVSKSKIGEFERTYPENLPPATKVGILVKNKSVGYAVDCGGKIRPLANRGFDHFRR